MEMEALASASAPNKYRYNGKELNEDFGLNWSDYGARWYDAAVGRWWSVDPMAEQYVGWSVYNYTMGNPIKFVDPDGMSVVGDYYTESGRYLGSDGKKDDKTYLVAAGAYITHEKKDGTSITTILPSGIKDLNISHKLFLSMSAWSYNENTQVADAQKASLGMLKNMTTAKDKYWGFENINTLGDALDLIHKRNPKANFDNQNDFLDDTGIERNSKSGMMSALSASIHVLTGGRDYSNGAIDEQGKDFFAPGWPMYDKSRKFGYSWAENGTFNGTYTPKSHPAYLTVQGKYRYLITASYGGNTYSVDLDGLKKK